MNDECGDFWFWFIRPFAEMLGGLTIFAICVVIYIGYYLYATREKK